MIAEENNNWYEYVGNDPVNFTDPTGLEAASNWLNSSNSSSYFSPVMSSTPVNSGTLLLPSSGGSLSLSDFYATGSPGTLTASPSPAPFVDNWSEGAKIVTTVNTRFETGKAYSWNEADAGLKESQRLQALYNGQGRYFLSGEYADRVDKWQDYMAGLSEQRSNSAAAANRQTGYDPQIDARSAARNSVGGHVFTAGAEFSVHTAAGFVEEQGSADFNPPAPTSVAGLAGRIVGRTLGLGASAIEIVGGGFLTGTAVVEEGGSLALASPIAVPQAAAGIVIVGRGVRSASQAFKPLDLGKIELYTHYRNPWGQNGAPDHQGTVKKLVRQAQDEFPEGEIWQNKSILEKTGINRRPDVSVIDPKTGKVLKVYEAARQNQNGTWVSREGAKQTEYTAKGVQSHFEPVK